MKRWIRELLDKPLSDWAKPTPRQDSRRWVSLDLTDQTFGSLTVIEAAPNLKSWSRGKNWLCRCSCGAEVIAPSQLLRRRRERYDDRNCCPECWAKILLKARAERKAHRAADILARMVSGEGNCALCDKKFTYAVYDGASIPRCCCPSHSKQLSQAIRRGRGRARSLSCKVIESVNPYAIFRRDRYVCQICHKPCDPALRGTLYNGAPEVDHRIPFALDGSHTEANTQTAHRGCNNRKAAGAMPA